MTRFELTATPIANLTRVQRMAIEDRRGYLSRLYCAEEFAETSLSSIAQINHSLTRRKGTVRGMHYQLSPPSETKLVSCVHGEVFDVAVDLRRGSPTFLKWHGELLSAANRRSLLIPQGFAHGFQALTDASELVYLHSAPYHPDAERALNAADPRLAIAWPLAIAELSDRDRGHPMLTADFSGIEA
jgi:dTDP-4-dehydrorhamnose 3,5-epimerase